MAKAKRASPVTKKVEELPEGSARPFFPTGCDILDMHLGRVDAGYCQGQIVNIMGEHSQGKSLMAAEAAASFHALYGENGEIDVYDQEDAWDVGYLATLGVPEGAIKLIYEVPKVSAGSTKTVPCDTIELIQADILRKCLAVASSKKLVKPKLLFIIDSWDQLSTDGTMELAIARAEKGSTKGSMGAEKAKAGSEFGRIVTAALKQCGATLIVISQLRDSLAMYGETKKRSGGNWLDFYPSQMFRLLKLSKAKARITVEVAGVDRLIGHWFLLDMKKNRRDNPKPPVAIPLIYGFGMCNLRAFARYLIDEGLSKDNKIKSDYIDSVHRMPVPLYVSECARLKKACADHLTRIREATAPLMQKCRIPKDG